MLMQQFTSRSIHPLSNERGDIKKKEVTSVKHKPTDGVVVLGGLITRNISKTIQHRRMDSITD